MMAIFGVATPRLPKLQALRDPNFRWFWLSTSGQALAQGMQFLILGLLVLEFTGSVFQLGLTVFFYGIPNLTLVLFGGIFANRINCKNLLLLSHFGSTLVMFGVSSLILTELLEVWQIYAASFLLGMLQAVNVTARQSMAVNLVEREDAMNATVMNATLIIGPAVAGFIINLADFGAALAVSACCYLVAAICALLIRNFRRTDPEVQRENFRNSWDGSVYFWNTYLVFATVSIGFAFGFFGMSYFHLIPAFAELWGLSAEAVGMQLTAVGLGSLAANLALARLVKFKNKNLLLIGFMLLFEASLFLFARSTSFSVSWVILLFVGLGSAGYISLGTTALQSSVPQELRGQVMRLWYISAGFMFIGALPLSLVVERFGWSLALSGGAAVCLIYTIWLAAWRPTLRPSGDLGDGYPGKDAKVV